MDSMKLKLEFDDDETLLVDDIIDILEFVSDINALCTLLEDKGQYYLASLTPSYDLWLEFYPRRLVSRDRASRIEYLSKQSPLSIEVVLGSVTAVWLLVQIVEKVTNFSLVRRNLKLETAVLEQKARELGVLEKDLTHRKELGVLNDRVSRLEKMLLRREKGITLKRYGVFAGDERENQRDSDPSP
jgi:hypothetical protein